MPFYSTTRSAVQMTCCILSHYDILDHPITAYTYYIELIREVDNEKRLDFYHYGGLNSQP
jgi:hypothetical protein